MAGIHLCTSKCDFPAYYCRHAHSLHCQSNTHSHLECAKLMTITMSGDKASIILGAWATVFSVATSKYLNVGFSGVSREVLRVLQHPPAQLNNSSQHRKQIATYPHLSSKQQSDDGWGWSCQLANRLCCACAITQQQSMSNPDSNPRHAPGFVPKLSDSMGVGMNCSYLIEDYSYLAHTCVCPIIRDCVADPCSPTWTSGVWHPHTHTHTRVKLFLVTTPTLS